MSSAGRASGVMLAGHLPKIPKQRTLIVGRDGKALQKRGLDTAWQPLIKHMIAKEVIDNRDQFGLRDLKRKGITGTVGTRHEKQKASGQMINMYDLSVPLVATPETQEKAKQST